MIATFIPAPPPGLASISIGPLTVHAYALCILAGIFFAIWYTTRRWVERGGDAEVVGSVAFWAVPFGIIGGRLYHLITSPQQYFGEGGNPIEALYIWNGGLGIWGAVALGALGAYIGCRRHGVSFVTFMDAAAPAVLIAQAIGRLGNWFNQELFGGPTDLPWGLVVDPQYRPDGFEQYTTFHPTFLYELVWNLVGAALIVWLDKRYDLRGGRVFWLYVMVYTSGRLWIETVRIDDANHIWGFRVNTLVSAVVLVASTIIFFWLGARQRRLAVHVPRHILAAPPSDGGDPSVPADGGDPPVISDDAPAEERSDT
jgi:prolipoprotein diacylglyceryl transferase